MISHEHKTIFVHIPKNAGQSIEHVFLKLLGLSWEDRAPLVLRANDNPRIGPPRLAHLLASEYVGFHYISQELFDQYYKFAIVRNPWARVVSFYKYFGYDIAVDFNYFVEKLFHEHFWEKKYWFVQPQHLYIYDENGNNLVDFIGRFENLEHDFAIIAKKIGITAALPHVNKSKKRGFDKKLRKFAKHPSIFFHGLGFKSTKKKHFKEYYNEKSVKTIAEYYKKDIELFNYEW